MPRVKDEERQKIGKVFTDTAQKLDEGTLNGRADAYAEIIAYTQPLMTDETWKPLFLDLTEALKAKELDDRAKLAEALKLVGETISGREVKAGPVSTAIAEGVIGAETAVEEEIQPEPEQSLEEKIQVEEPPAEPPADESQEGQDGERIPDPPVNRQPAQRYSYPSYYNGGFPAWGGMW